MRMRKKQHGADRLLALSSLVIAKPETLFDAPAAPFENDRPLRLEIGCGKGDFICGMSAAEDEYNYYAMEKISDIIVIAAEKYAGIHSLGTLAPNGGWLKPDGTVCPSGETWDIPMSERGNVRFIPADASGLEEYFPENTFEAIYINFCDPWDKKGYASRRLTHPDFLKKYKKLLIPGGYLRFKTDNTALFDYSLETVASSGFDMVFSTRDLHSSEHADTNIMTEYEHNFSDKGIKINCIEAKSVK